MKMLLVYKNIIIISFNNVCQKLINSTKDHFIKQFSPILNTEFTSVYHLFLPLLKRLNLLITETKYDIPVNTGIDKSVFEQKSNQQFSLAFTSDGIIFC